MICPRKMLISTHAPVRGATYCVNPNIKGVPQFQLTPLRRGRHQYPEVRFVLFYFYSRPHGRGDYTINKQTPGEDLFLLAPPREGRRKIALSLSQKTANFYSRPHGRGDSSPLRFIAACMKFLLAPPREGRLGCCGISTACHVFLLAPPREGRHTSIPAHPQTIIFLLAPPREGRQAFHRIRGNAFYFYSRPHGRGDLKPPQL